MWLYLFIALALPCYRLMQTTYRNPITRAAAGRRFGQIGLGLAAILLLSWFVPWQDTVKRGVVLEHAAVEPVTARITGFLREVYVHDGEPVAAFAGVLAAPSTRSIPTWAPTSSSPCSRS